LAIIAEIIGMNILSIENLTKTYGERVLFTNITFGVSMGDKIAIVAKNGSGKSTLMKILAGKDIADSGKVVFRNDIKVGYLDQNPFLQEDKTIEENIFSADNDIIKAIKQYEELLENTSIPNHDEELQKAISGIDNLNAWDFENKVKVILGKLDIHQLNREVKTLSGGQKKRIALAKLLLDEPDSGLEQSSRQKIIDLIQETKNRDGCVLLVTHDKELQELYSANKLDLTNA
jgi:ATP-binding cassette subfamily F protein uup